MSKPTKVYLAWVGRYSDARVIGAYSDEETAFRVARAFEPISPRTELYEVDAGPMPPEEAGLALWWAVSCLNGPEIEECHKGQSWYGGIDRIVGIGNVVPAYGTTGDPLHVYVYARDEEHARKIAGDKFRDHFALWGMRSKP